MIDLPFTKEQVAHNPNPFRAGSPAHWVFWHVRRTGSYPKMDDVPEGRFYAVKAHTLRQQFGHTTNPKYKNIEEVLGTFEVDDSARVNDHIIFATEEMAIKFKLMASESLV